MHPADDPIREGYILLNQDSLAHPTPFCCTSKRQAPSEQVQNSEPLGGVKEMIAAMFLSNELSLAAPGVDSSGARGPVGQTA